MKLTVIASSDNCTGGTCPTAYLTDRGTYIIQGDPVTDEEALALLALPAGETAVEVPAWLAERIARALSG